MNKVNVFILLFTSLFLGGCNSENNVVEKKDEIKTVKFLDLSTIKGFKDSREFPAQIHPFKNTNLAFELSGKVVKFNFKVGDKLKKGDVIAQLDDTIYRSNLNAARAHYEKALADHKRYKKLYNSKTISIDMLEKMKKNLDVTQSNYEIAKKNFDNTKLLAEFDGILAQKYIDDFARITAKQKIAVLQDTSKFKVKFYVPENDIINGNEKEEIKDINNKIDFFTQIGENEKLKYKSILIDVSRKAESVTRTYETTLIFQNPNNVNILAGMTAKVIALDKEKIQTVLFIPLKALFSDSTKNSFVWIVDKENRVKKNAVKTGRLEKNSIEITSGLKGTESIAISGVHLLQENQQVKAYKKLGK